MKPTDMVIVKVIGRHEDRTLRHNFVPGEQYVLERHKAEVRMKKQMVVIVRLADSQQKAMGAAPENKMEPSAPETKTLEANTRAELVQLAEAMSIEVKGSANKTQIVQSIVDERKQKAAAQKEADLDAEAIKGGAVKA